jgi:septal ring factor EnvC (AmiA/AmiB activator)
VNETIKKGIPWALLLLMSAIALFLFGIVGSRSDESEAIRKLLNKTETERDNYKNELEKLNDQLRTLERNFAEATNKLYQTQKSRKASRKSESELPSMTNVPPVLPPD